MDLQKYLSLKPSDQYSIEPHGDGFALYYGRSNSFHGWRLCNLTEVDPKVPDLLQRIVDGLNGDSNPHS
jgi:hypothetical protein